MIMQHDILQCMNRWIYGGAVFLRKRIKKNKFLFSLREIVLTTVCVCSAC